jgi:hypothetical protein
MLAAERRRSAPITASELAVLKAGSAAQAWRWALAARESGLNCLAREAAHALAAVRRSCGRDDARVARRHSDLCFYRMHALRCRDAARRLIPDGRAAWPQTDTGSSKGSHGATFEQRPQPEKTDLV